MRVSEIHFFGKPNCGKKELLQAIKLKRSFVHLSDYSHSVLDEETDIFFKITNAQKDSTLIVADYDDLPTSRPKIVQLIAYCIDISEEIDLNELTAILRELKNKYSPCKMILISTNSELVDRTTSPVPGVSILTPEFSPEKQRLLRQSFNDNGLVDAFCSVTRDFRYDRDLIDTMHHIFPDSERCFFQVIQQLHNNKNDDELATNIMSLSSGTRHLQEKERYSIANEVQIMINMLLAPNTDTTIKRDAIIDFRRNCHQLLSTRFPTAASQIINAIALIVLYALLVFVVTGITLVLTIAATTGYWLGIVALFEEPLAAITLIIGAMCGAGLGAMCAHNLGFFLSPGTANSLDDFNLLSPYREASHQLDELIESVEISLTL